MCMLDIYLFSPLHRISCVMLQFQIQVFWNSGLVILSAEMLMFVCKSK